MNQISFDVIIPTFNRANYLERTINSVINQTYQNFQIYIIDDGSTDNTKEVLKSFSKDERLHYFYQENKGVSAARNNGVNISSSPWIAFLDSDDEWEKNKLEIQEKFILENPHLNFIHSEEIWIRNGVRVNPKIKHSKNSQNLFERSLEFCLVSPSTVIIKRELFLRHNGFNPQMTVCEDFDLWNKILAAEEIGFIQEALIKKHGGHDDQLSAKYFAMDYWRIKSLVDLFKNVNTTDDQKKLIQEVVIKKSELLLKNYLKYQNQIHYEEIKNIIKSIGINL